jgi:hypothetical protein
MRRFLLVTGLLLLAAGRTAVWADPPTFMLDSIVQVSGTSLFTSCTADGVGS